MPRDSALAGCSTDMSALLKSLLHSMVAEIWAEIGCFCGSWRYAH